MPDKKKELKLTPIELDRNKVKESAAAAKEPTKRSKAKTRGSRPNIFVRIWGGLKRWVKELRSEAKKVTWPTFKQVVNNTLIVIAMTALVGAVIWLSDVVFRNGLQIFLDLI